MRVTDCKVVAATSRRRLRSTDTLETVVVRYGEGSWPEADSGPSSTGVKQFRTLALSSIDC